MHLAIARGFDEVTVHGFDSDEASVVEAKLNAAQAGVSARTHFWHRDASSVEGHCDPVCCFESLHDMAHPVGVLASVRRMALPGGAVFVVDERAVDALTGTVMRTATLERYAAEAGFTSVDVLPIEHDAFRFHRLHP